MMSQQKQFCTFLKQALETPERLETTPNFEKLKPTDISSFNEAEALTSGAFLEAVIQKGEGENTPKDGDLVYFHFSVHPSGDETEVVYSTRPDHENSGGCPLAAVLNKSPRLPRGWEVALLQMHKSERRILKIRPEFGFQHQDCQYHLPEYCAKAETEEMSVDIQLVNWYDSSEVMTVNCASSKPILKRILEDGEGYENPRPPYKVEALICFRRVSVDAVQGKGEIIFGSMKESLCLTMGDETIPTGLSDCLGSMAKKEKSICLISAKDLIQSSDKESLFPSPPKDVEQVEVEIHILNVIQVRDLYGDGKVTKHRMKDGIGMFPSDCPIHDCRVNIHYKARAVVDFMSTTNNVEESAWCYNSKEQEGTTPISVDLGCGHLPYGLEGCIHLMLPGEVSFVRCKADLAYSHPSTRCSVPTGLSKSDDIEIEVELISFEKGVEWAGISVKEALAEALRTKNMANELYKQGATLLASNKYKTIIKQLSAMKDFDSEEQVQEADELTITCFSNLASCSIQEADYSAAIDWCNKALKIDEQCVKALFKRAKAYSLKGDFEQAEVDLEEVLQLDEKLRSDVEDALLKNKQRKKAALVKQKQQFRNFFDRN